MSSTDTVAPASRLPSRQSFASFFIARPVFAIVLAIVTRGFRTLPPELTYEEADASQAATPATEVAGVAKG